MSRAVTWRKGLPSGRLHAYHQSDPRYPICGQRFTYTVATFHRGTPRCRICLYLLVSEKRKTSVGPR